MKKTLSLRYAGFALSLVAGFFIAVPTFAATNPYATGTCSLSFPSASNASMVSCTFDGGADVLDETQPGLTYLQFDSFITGSSDCTDVDDDVCPQVITDSNANWCNGYAGNRDVFVRFLEWDGVSQQVDILPVGNPGNPGENVAAISCADVCGNGVVDGTEECDVGPGLSTDGCVDPTEPNECMFVTTSGGMTEDEGIIFGVLFFGSLSYLTWRIVSAFKRAFV